MDTGAEALARRAQRFGNAGAMEEVGEMDEEGRLAEVRHCSLVLFSLC